MRRLAYVLADDLTGACDVGGELLALGRPVRVRSHGRDDVPSPADAIAVDNTQSRAVGEAEAVRRVTARLRPSRLMAGDVALKKIDTALRGHVAAELGAVIGRLRPGLTLVAPAIPEVGRTTEGGRQLVGGVPVSETAFGRDPVNPVVDSSVVETVQRIPGARVFPVGLGTVRDPDAYARLVASALAGPAPILVADAVTTDDLVRSVVAASTPDGSLLVVGSIGVTGALVGSMGGAAAGPARVRPSGDGGRGILVVCGSVHPVARSQLRALEEATGVPPCIVQEAPERSGRAVGEIVAASGVGVLASPPGATDPLRVGAALGEALRAAVERHRPRALVLIGGETAYHCLGALGQPDLEVEARTKPLVVCARIATGRWRGVGVLSKGGSAGDAETICEMIALADGGG